MSPQTNEEQLVEASRLREAEAPVGRDRAVAIASALAFLVVAGAMAVALPSERSPSLLVVAVLVAALAVASLVEFEVGSGHAVPTELVFVPMLFVLPASMVPLAAAAAYLLAHAVNLRRRQAALERALVMLGSSWYAVGPALVLALAGEPAASFEQWPVLALAFAAQLAFDLSTGVASEWVAFGTSPRTMLGFLRSVYAVDTILAPVGLAVAIATAAQPLLVVLVLPLTGLLAYFASERRRRIDQALELSQAYRGTALLLGDVVEADDEYTGSHSRGVVELVLAVASELGLDDRTRVRAEFTALLHDVGKIAIPKEIINKPGALDAEERAIIETHTVEGEKILSRIGGVLSEVGVLVRSCHERWDGAGYPDGLAGDDIPLVARIVCTCDAYSAMTTDRSYRAARPPAEALAELVRCAGTHFDPAVVTALVAVIERGLSARTADALPHAA